MSTYEAREATLVMFYLYLWSIQYTCGDTLWYRIELLQLHIQLQRHRKLYFWFSLPTKVIWEEDPWLLVWAVVKHRWKAEVTGVDWSDYWYILQYKNIISLPIVLSIMSPFHWLVFELTLLIEYSISNFCDSSIFCILPVCWDFCQILWSLGWYFFSM